MPNELPIPDDLSSLIEKREQSDRRQANRRSDQEGESADVENDQRSDQDRRHNGRRQDD